MEFIWNSEYIAQHTLDNHIITDSGIKLLNEDEIFVEHQDFSRYFISQYGRAISLKRKQPQLLRESIQGTRENQYPAFGIGINGQSMITGRAVAEIFCPNFWNRFKRMPNIYNSALEAHHCDKNPIIILIWYYCQYGYTMMRTKLIPMRYGVARK